MSTVIMSCAASVINHDGKSYIHFSTPRKLSGNNGSLYFPMDADKPLLEQFAEILAVNNVGQKVIEVEKFRDNNRSQSYSVMYEKHPLARHTT
ncbi:hypothetical protein J4Z08_22945 [Citrobacter portucalensis]|uniref:hypothetical protein n=1 Tax=Citrobacter portucalensis TaxID=1639133 RepID=UPI0031402679